MGLLDRDYMKDAPRWHMGEGFDRLPEQKVVYVTRPVARKRHGNSWLGGILLLLLVGGAIWGTATGTINWSTIATMLGGNYGVHVCTVNNYDLNNVECTSDSPEIDQLSQGRLAISQHNAFVSTSFTMTLSRQMSDGTLNQICATSLVAIPGDNRIAWHLDQAIQQCGASLAQGATYQIAVAQDTQSMGTTTFTYGHASSASAPLAADRPRDHWTLVLCPAWTFDAADLLCGHTSTRLRHSELAHARFVLTGHGSHATINGRMRFVVFRFNHQAHWIIQADYTSVFHVKGGYTSIAGYEGQIFHLGHAPPIRLDAPYKMSVYKNGHKLVTLRFTIAKG